MPATQLRHIVASFGLFVLVLGPVTGLADESASAATQPPPDEVQSRGFSLPSVSVPPPPPPQSLTVRTIGNGSGKVMIPPAATCPPACAATYPKGAPVVLAAVPAPGSMFVGWSGDCQGTAPCALTMDRARTVEAKFNKTQAATPSPWAQWSQQAAAAARQEARMWLQNGYLDGAFCKVNSTVVTAPPGVLKSRHAFNGAIKQALITAGAPIGVAQEWDGAFKTAWESWAAQVTIPGLPWYPTFAAWPGPSAPPTPNPPTPLSALVSPKASVLSPSNLANAIQAKLAGQASESSAKTAITSFANDFAGRFGQCLAGCMVVNVMGSGKVPTYSTRTAPAGPVSGTCSGGTITVTGF